MKLLINTVEYDYINAKLNNLISMLKIFLLVFFYKSFIYGADDDDKIDRITIACGEKSPEDIAKTADVFVVPWTSEQMMWILRLITDPANPRLVTRAHTEQECMSMGILHLQEQFKKDPVKLRFYLTIAYFQRCSEHSDFSSFARNTCPKPAQIAFLCFLKSEKKFPELSIAVKDIYGSDQPTDKNPSGFFMFNVVAGTDKILAIQHARSFLEWRQSRYTQGLLDLFDDRQVSDLYTSCAFNCYMPGAPDKAVEFLSKARLLHRSITSSYNLAALYDILSKTGHPRRDFYEAQKRPFVDDIILRMRKGEQLPSTAKFLQSLPHSGSAIALDITTTDVDRLLEQNESRPLSLALSFDDLLSRCTTQAQQNGTVLEFLAMTANNISPQQFSDPSTLPIADVEILKALSWSYPEQVSAAFARTIARLPFMPELTKAAMGIRYLAGLDEEKICVGHPRYVERNARLIRNALYAEILRRTRNFIRHSQRLHAAAIDSTEATPALSLNALITDRDEAQTDSLTDVLPADAARTYSTNPMLHDLLRSAHYSKIPGLSEEVSFMLTGSSGISVFLKTSTEGDGYVLNPLCCKLFNTTEITGKPPKNVLQMLRRKGIAEDSDLYKFWENVYNQTWGQEKVLAITAAAATASSDHARFCRGSQITQPMPAAKKHRSGAAQAAADISPEETSDSEEDNYESPAIFREAMRAKIEIPEAVQPLLRLEVESSTTGSRSKCTLYRTEANGSEVALASFRPHRKHAAIWQSESDQSLETQLMKILWNLYYLQSKTPNGGHNRD